MKIQKIICLLLAFIMIALCLAGCRDDKDDKKENAVEENAAETAEKVKEELVETVEEAESSIEEATQEKPEPLEEAESGELSPIAEAVEGEEDSEDDFAIGGD